MQVKNPLSSLHCLSAASLQAVGFLAGMSFRIIRGRNRERLFLLFFCVLLVDKPYSLPLDIKTKSEYHLIKIISKLSTLYRKYK
jgi:hypothetical protein